MSSKVESKILDARADPTVIASQKPILRTFHRASHLVAIAAWVRIIKSCA
jgi:hypothetical protein